MAVSYHINSFTPLGCIQRTYTVRKSDRLEGDRLTNKTNGNRLGGAPTAAWNMSPSPEQMSSSRSMSAKTSLSTIAIWANGGTEAGRTSARNQRQHLQGAARHPKTSSGRRKQQKLPAQHTEKKLKQKYSPLLTYKSKPNQPSSNSGSTFTAVTPDGGDRSSIIPDTLLSCSAELGLLSRHAKLSAREKSSAEGPWSFRPSPLQSIAHLRQTEKSSIWYYHTFSMIAYT